MLSNSENLKSVSHLGLNRYWVMKDRRTDRRIIVAKLMRRETVLAVHIRRLS